MGIEDVEEIEEAMAAMAAMAVDTAAVGIAEDQALRR